MESTNPILRNGGLKILYLRLIFYTGTNTAGSHKCNGPFVVNKLKEGLRKSLSDRLFFDNWFCALDLCIDLKHLGILTTATIRSDRLKGCQLPSKKELKTQEEEHLDTRYKCDVNTGLVMV